MKKLNILDKIIAFLFIILITILLYIFLQYKTTKTNSLSPPKLAQQVANSSTNEDNIKLQTLKDEFKKQNKMIVLSGSRRIQATYHVQDWDLNYGGKTNFMNFLVGKLNEMGSKSITITTTYLYSYTYDFNSLDIIKQDNKYYIKLWDSNVELQPLAEKAEERIIENEYGILAKAFTPQEISAIMTMTQVKTYNNVINNNILIDKALENTKENIENLTQKLCIDVQVIIVPRCELIENNEVKVLSDSNT